MYTPLMFDIETPEKEHLIVVTKNEDLFFGNLGHMIEEKCKFKERFSLLIV